MVVFYAYPGLFLNKGPDHQGKRFDIYLDTAKFILVVTNGITTLKCVFAAGKNNDPLKIPGQDFEAIKEQFIPI